eukprot:12836050-Ditylum_brightwellii.AAC.1
MEKPNLPDCTPLRVPRRSVTPEPTMAPQCNLPPQTPPTFIPTPKGFCPVYPQHHGSHIIPPVYNVNFASTIAPVVPNKERIPTEMIANRLLNAKTGEMMECRDLIKSNKKYMVEIKCQQIWKVSTGRRNTHTKGNKHHILHPQKQNP